MSESDKSLVELLKEGHSSKASEHILNVLKAGFATAPFMGGIASLMEDYIPNLQQARLEEFAIQVEKDLVKKAIVAVYLG